MQDFNGQNVLVTGGTRGIGAGISKAFLQSGAHVVATYAGNHEAAQAFQTSVAELPGSLETHSCDVTSREAVEQLFDALDSQSQELDVLICNAGIRKDNIIGMMPEEDWDAVLDTNLKGSFLMSKYAIQRMARKRYGRIIFVSSAAVDFGFPGQSNYSASKAGQIGLMKSLVKEVGRRKITVNCITPGFIETELISDFDETTQVEYKKMVPLGRFGTTEEVAHSVMFLASPQASYISGAVMSVSGGLG